MSAVRQPKADKRVIHVLPVGDKHMHAALIDCHCWPTMTEPGIVMHHALDGREAIERAMNMQCSEGWVLIEGTIGAASAETPRELGRDALVREAGTPAAMQTNGPAPQPRPLPDAGLAPWVDETGWCVRVTVTYAGQQRSSAVVAVKDHAGACAAYAAAVEAARARGWSGEP